MGITWLSRANVFLQLSDTGSTVTAIHRRKREENISIDTIYGLSSQHKVFLPLKM